MVVANELEVMLYSKWALQRGAELRSIDTALQRVKNDVASTLTAMQYF